ncbi:MAG: hypothetical protein IPN67_06080 [Bacteroidales bacterium]|nr:hypothetical protein [Bacteroidales bacterium]
MEKSNLNSRREFLQKMLAATALAGFYPYLNKTEDTSLIYGYVWQTA